MRVEEYFVLKDGSSTLRLAKLDSHSVLKSRRWAVLRHWGVIEIYEIDTIRTIKGETKTIVEYELGRCIRCIKCDALKEEVLCH